MEQEMNVCQSCGMPLGKEPKGGGTNADNSKSEKYCSFCYHGGKFTDDGITLEEKVNKNIQIAVSMLGMSEGKARELAQSILPNLERWKNLQSNPLFIRNQ